MAEKIIYGSGPQAYKIDEKGKEGELGTLLYKILGKPIISGTIEKPFDIFHYNETTILARYEGLINRIIAVGKEEKIKEIEKGLVKKLKEAEIY